MENSELIPSIVTVFQYMVDNKKTFQETADFFDLTKEELVVIIETKSKELETKYPKLLKQVKKILKEEQTIETIARFIIDNQVTNQTAAEEFDLSKSTIQKYINKRLVRVSSTLYNQLKETQKIVLNRSQILGGTIGKRGPSITDFEALEMAEARIENRLTFKELEKKFGTPSSTIYGALKRLDYPDHQSKLEQTTVIIKRLGTRNTQLKIDKEEIFKSKRN